MNSNPAMARLQRATGAPLLLDGAMGTELARRGVAIPPPLWSTAGLIEAPTVVEKIHRDYTAAGADILVANTFRTNPAALAAAGYERDGLALNAQAVRLARRAAAFELAGQDREAPLIAASIAPSADCYRPDLVPDEATLRREHMQMMAWVAAAQPDLAWIETMGTVREAAAAGRAARERWLPFVVSFVLNEGGDLLGGESLAAAVAAVEPLEPLAIGLNCIPPRGITAHLPRLRQLTTRPIAVYAHIGNASPLPGWSFGESATPEQYAELAAAWREAGATIIGGCCGTTPGHIAACRAILARVNS
ncbi:MAG: homocysteine S-methyltransferase family protein [Phycisphaerales bacterium]|nr:homocysteine S-methyltransferase family protein [Phycisphaerales bacterium]